MIIYVATYIYIYIYIPSRYIFIPLVNIGVPMVVYLYGVLGVLSCFVFRSFFLFLRRPFFGRGPPLCCSFLFRCFFSVNVNFMLLFVIFKRLHFDTHSQRRRQHRPCQHQNRRSHRWNHPQNQMYLPSPRRQNPRTL